MRLTVRLTPGAGVDSVEVGEDGTLRARVAARPIDGAANAALIALLAKSLGIARTRVAIVAGARGRAKLVEFEGIDPGLVRSRWPGADV